MTDLTAWRAQRTATITLDGGLVVTVRRITLLDIAAQPGGVPLPLVGQVEAFIADAEASRAGQIDLATFPEQIAIVDLVVRAAIISPPVANEADADHIALDEIPVTDRLKIFGWAQRGASTLIPFPGGSAGGPAA